MQRQSYLFSCARVRTNVRTLIVFACLLCLSPALFAQLLTTSQRCESVQPSGDINFRGITLRETPDISETEIRRINVLISTRCYKEATIAIARYKAANPSSYKIAFVEARLLWLLEGTDAMRQFVDSALLEHPEFNSLKVLIASSYLETGNVVAAQDLLDEIAKVSPTDLWVFTNRLKIEAQQSPTADTLKKCLEVTKNPQFPPSVREQAGLLLIRSPDAPLQMMDEAHKIGLSFESATPFSMKAENYAVFVMSTSRANPKKATEAIKRLIADDRSAPRAAELDVLLRITYLQQAAEMDPKPSVKNASLRKLATEGDTETLKHYLMSGPGLASLADLIVEEPEATPPAGH